MTPLDPMRGPDGETRPPSTPDIPAGLNRCECRGQCGVRHPGGRCGVPDGMQVRYGTGKMKGRWGQPSPHDKKSAKKPVTCTVLDDPFLGLRCQRCLGWS